MAKFIMRGVEYDLAETLTFGEETDIAREFGDSNRGWAAGLIWISVRRRHPQTTLDDLRDEVIEMKQDPGDELPPTNESANDSAEENA